jgi:hypothetical protein
MVLRSQIKAVLCFLFLSIFLKLPNSKLPTVYANGMDPNLNRTWEGRSVRDLPIAFWWGCTVSEPLGQNRVKK